MNKTSNEVHIPNLFNKSKFLEFVQICSFLFHKWDVLPDLLAIVRIDFVKCDIGILVQSNQNFTEWVTYCWMSPSLVNVRVLLVLGAAHSNSKALCVQGSSSK